jgi:hypothetical protein
MPQQHHCDAGLGKTGATLDHSVEEAPRAGAESFGKTVDG